MNFKIESNSLNLTNYPLIAEHFEAMVAKGWLIHKLIGRGLFIYKKIEPEYLDFSIAPYEIETTFTKKTKEELEEFKTVCKNVGWNYAAQHLNLHIYYKKAGAEATPIQTDQEEEFKTIERMGRKTIKVSYAQIATFLLLLWTQLRGMFTDTYWMKDGLAHIVASAIALFLISEVIDILRFRRFLSINRKNIEMGDSIKYSNSKSLAEKLISFIYPILTILFIFSIVYTGMGPSKKIYLLALLPTIIALTLAVLYRIFVKTSSIGLNIKIILLAGLFVISTALSSWLIFAGVASLSDDAAISDTEGLKVLSIEDFPYTKEEKDSGLMKHISLLIPKSYEYSSYSEDGVYMMTEYSKALNERVAESLAERYIAEASNQKISFISESLEMAFKDKTYVDWLDGWGLKEGDYEKLSKLSTREAVKIAKKIIRENNIEKDTENLWNLDEVYFLRDQNEEILIRRGREVFYISLYGLPEGKDLKDPEVIAIVKTKLGL